MCVDCLNDVCRWVLAYTHINTHMYVYIRTDRLTDMTGSCWACI
jgi:hypothetical protein